MLTSRRVLTWSEIRQSKHAYSRLRITLHKTTCHSPSSLFSPRHFAPAGWLTRSTSVAWRNMAKRARDKDSPTPSSPPAKRSTSTHSIQSSPIRPRSSPTFSTPFAYAVRTPLSVSKDSPTNPFGLKRSLTALELPRPTGFGKHICLRLQLVDSRPNPILGTKRRDKDGVHRVVQVPLNYTFRHLHKLILFLFASDIYEVYSQLSSSRRTSLRNPTSSTNTAQVKGKERASVQDPLASQWGGHFFEVLRDTVVHSNAMKPGVIKPGAVVREKLSSVRERRLFRDLLDPENAIGSSSALPTSLEDEDVEKEDWTWEAEDDFTLGQVWTRGPSLDRGIVYVCLLLLALVPVILNTRTVPPTAYFYSHHCEHAFGTRTKG